MVKRDCEHCGKEMTAYPPVKGVIEHQCDDLSCKYYEDTGDQYFELETNQDQVEAHAEQENQAKKEEG